MLNFDGLIALRKPRHQNEQERQLPKAGAFIETSSPDKKHRDAENALLCKKSIDD
jgi:hypothetical protein